ncbi:probable G-protein coupled receptor Mth-like 1 isoform X2 [Hermetia illucens]|uniref:probable G-protein coupled receptor Mth-like 1 isoform X2 n=1 Tax=Hermetia illucens TaxID=343691 RepID=UPI0018CC3782|nr:probable G-protein coupled receptor Mth-like 1 isoform X2 [Hermetia illucens]
MAPPTCNLLHVRLAWFTVLIFAASLASPVNGIATRTINKCCRIGEHLDQASSCIAGGSEKWVPQVYLINRKTTFEPRGEAPKFFRIQENTFPKTCQEPELFTGSSNVIIFSNGSLYLFEKNSLFAPEDYCAERDAALVCSPHQKHRADWLIAPRKLAKVHKCCGMNSAYNEENVTCLFYSDPKHPLYRARVTNSTNVEIIYGFPTCTVGHVIVGKYQDDLLNMESGQLTLESGKQLGPPDFCLEHTIEKDPVIDTDVTHVKIFACSEQFAVPAPAPETKQDIRFVLYSIGLMISVIFLSATLAAGFLMPSNHHVLHWRCQTYYVACLLVGDLLLAISQISGDKISGGTCITFAILMHFFFLAAFFWLNTMCFNIWWTFRDFRPTSLEKGQEMFRLRIYRVYAWGVPLIISGVAIVLDNIPSGTDDNLLRPRFGEAGCWFYGNMEILAYFFGPVGILLCINLLLFASTARQLTCGLWKREDVKSTTERAALGRVCLKLVVVMGVTWVADIISWMVGGPQSVWYVTDLINALQGVFIFIVVGCQPQVWSAVKRIWSSKTGRGVTNTTNGPQHSSSSHGLPSIGDSVTNNTLTNTTSTKVAMETHPPKLNIK